MPAAGKKGRRIRAAAAYFAASLALAGLGGLSTSLILDAPQTRSALIGIAIAWAAMGLGFLVLLPNLGLSGNRFLGAYAAGMLVRLAGLGAGLALSIWGSEKPEPLLVALALTYVVLLPLEGAVLWRTAGG